MESSRPTKNPFSPLLNYSNTTSAMKYFKLFSLIALLGITVPAYAQVENSPKPGAPAPAPVTIFPDLVNYNLPTANRNFVRSIIPSKPVTNSSQVSLGSQTAGPCVISAQYFDGLGRPSQEVARSAAGNNVNSDIITVHTYDNLGRETNRYLPYSVADQYALVHGRLRTDPLNALSGQYQSLYPGDQPYSTTEYDGSPLNRVTRTWAPGASWIGADHAETYVQRTNTADEDVRLWTIGAGAADMPYSSRAYNAGELHANVFYDEENKYVVEYKDKQGRTVLKKSFLESIQNGGPHLQFACTYFVYDDLSRLRFVITPQAVHAVCNSGWSLASAAGLCYRYSYDGRGRVIQKQLPDKETEYLIYDAHDRLVLTQDGNMRSGGQSNWLFTTYDARSRPLTTGLYTDPLQRSPLQLQSEIESTNGSYTTNDLLYFLKNTDLIGAYPNTRIADAEAYTYTYYDDYSHASGAIFNSSFNSMLTGNSAYCSMPGSSAQTRGLVTGTLVKVMDQPSTNSWITTTNFYDDKGQLIQQQAGNVVGGLDITTCQYDFQGTLASSVLHHTTSLELPPYNVTNIVKKFTKNYYTGKITAEDQDINGIGFRNISSTTFDAFGRAINKQLGAIANNVYNYNVRGWLTGINQSGIENYGSNEFFHERLSYDRGFSQPRYDAGISGIEWRGHGSLSPRRYYGYSYDPAERLTDAWFGEWNPGDIGWNRNKNDYGVSSIRYDANGNISQMYQRGPGLDANGHAVPVDMDQMHYTYAPLSNRLMSVSEADNSIVTTAPDFRDGNTNGDDYDYDANGNLTIDRNKGITTPIVYSLLNKPVHIEVQNKGSVDYTYDALGNLLRSTVSETGHQTKTTDYCGPVVYENRKQKYILHSEGRCRPDPAAAAGTTAYLYDYFVKDHLGNVRTVIGAKETSGLEELVYQTGLEVAHAYADGLLWTHLDDVRADKPDATPGDVKAALLDGSDPARRIGTAIMIKVMPGDKFRVSADSWYDGVNNEGGANSQDVVGSLLSALSGGSLYEGVTVAELPHNMQIIQSTFGNEQVTNAYDALTSNVFDPQYPAAYLNYLLTDENGEVMDGSGVLQAKGAASAWNSNESGEVEVGKAGYLTVWTANKGVGPLYYDRVSVVFYKGEVLEENHYYPFGLTLSTASGNANEKNNYKLTTKELQDDLGLNWYNFGARMQDMQTGRWLQIDPYAEKTYAESPYSYVGNTPSSYVDVQGNFKIQINSDIAKQLNWSEANISRFIQVNKSLPSFLKNSPAILTTLSKTSGLNEEQILYYATYGNGPTLRIGDYPAFSELTTKTFNDDEVHIRYQDVQALEEAGGSQQNIDAYMFASASVLLHELAHYGDRICNGGVNTGQNVKNVEDKDEGEQFWKTSKTGHRGTDVDDVMLFGKFIKNTDAQNDNRRNRSGLGLDGKIPDDYLKAIFRSPNFNAYSESMTPQNETR